MLCGVLAYAQNRVITGQIKDDKGDPVPFASIKVKGTEIGTAADQQGMYKITAANNSVLVITSVGFAPYEVTVGANPLINVNMSRLGQLTEVIVTALGQTARKDKVGYSTTAFKAEDVVRSAPVSALDGLQGRVPGADISTIGGQPGSSGKIILRGYSSFTSGNNQALIVVDGVPFNNARLGSFNDFLNSGGADFGNGLNDLNPNDIENISILKGTAAASLYGQRGANGVVLVTTKRGRSGKITVDFTSSAMGSSVMKLPDFQNTWGQGWNGQHWKEENGSWGPKMDGSDRLWGSNVDNSRLLKSFSAKEDNVREFYDEGLEFNNSISMRGGNENANFYMSYGNVYSDGILPGNVDVYRRNSFSARGQIKSNKFLASASMNYLNKSGSTVSSQDDEQGSSTFENIIQIPRDIKITDFKDYNNKFFNVDNYFTPYASNPYFSINENGNKNANDRIFGNVELGYDFSKAINVRWRTGLDVANARVKDWQAIESPKPNSWRGAPSTNAEGASLTPLVGGVRELSDYARELNSDLFINIDKELSTDLNLSGFIGFNYNEQQTRTQQSRIKALTIPKFYDLSNSPNPPVTTATTTKKRLIGTFAQANLAYKDYLFLTVNARNDWSSTLKIGNNSFFYPGANMSLVLSKLLDVSGVGISYFKVRGAYGKTGKDAPVYSLYSTGVAGNAALGFGNILFPINGVSGYEVANSIGKLDLKPEITTEIEFGTEIRFIKDRIGLDVTYYKKRTKDQIIAVPVASSSGYQTAVSNFGLIENKGIELSLNIVPIKTKDFSWTINYIFSQNRNKVLELPEGLDKVDFNSTYDIKMVARVGQPVGIIEAPTKVYTDDGRPVVDGSTGMFKQSTEDFSYGNIQRDFSMGLNNSLTYKNWGLGFNFDYRKGGVFVSRTADLTYFVGNAWLTQYNDRRPFIIPNSVIETGVDANNKPVYAENTSPIDVNNYNSYWYHTTNQVNSWENTILPKDFIKLRDITLSYRLPVDWAKKVGANNIVFSAIGRNFLIWVPQKNTFIDPESTNLGNDLVGEFGEQATSASTKSYGVSLKINF